jgi:DNA polymerase-3 subunit delta'
MPFRKILGQSTAVEILTRALGSGRIHHAYRFEGPDGVGKEMAAFAVAQSLVCDAPRENALACCECSACRRAVTLANEPPNVPLHPDVVLIGKGLYPPAVLGTSSPETSAIGIEQIRKMILGRMGYSSHEGKYLVFIVRNAEELSQGAANALLKTLEEPPARVQFILLTSRPNRLLDTIRSRTMPIRFRGLSDAILTQILERQGVNTNVVPLAQGSARLALDLADSEKLEYRDKFVEVVRQAIEAKDLGSALELLGKKQEDRDELRVQLAWVQARFSTEARQLVDTNPAAAERLAHFHRIVLETSRDVDRNGQPALMLEAMMTKLRRI